MRTAAFILVALIFCLGPVSAFAQDEAQRAARISAYESRIQDTLADRLSDWFAVFGKSKEERESILRERRAQRIEQRLEETAREKEAIEEKAAAPLETAKDQQIRKTEEKEYSVETAQPASPLIPPPDQTGQVEEKEDFFKQHHGGLSREEFREKMFRVHHYGLDREEFETLRDKDMTAEEYDALHQRFRPCDEDYYPLTEEEYELLFKQHHGWLSREELLRQKEDQPQPQENR